MTRSHVRLGSGRRERVRLIGIDTPERGACLSAGRPRRRDGWPTASASILRGDATQDTRDRYGRLLAYAWVRGRDLGFQQVASGLARVYVYDRPFQRLSAYRRAEQARPRRGRRTSGAAARTPVAPTRRRRRARTATRPTRRSASHRRRPDLDCAEVAHVAFAVRGADPHGFDGDGDGVGCEG